MSGKCWGMPLYGSVVHTYPIACSRPEGRFPRFFHMQLTVGNQSANSTHGTDVWILAFVTFRTGHIQSCPYNQVFQ